VIFDRQLDAWVLSRYADVLAALREPALWPVGPRRETNLKIPDAAAQQILRTQVLEAYAPPRLNDWQNRMDAIAVVDDPDDLVSEVIEPWCLTASEIVTGSDPADRERLLAAARVISDAAASPGQETHAADAELEEYFRNSALPMAGPVFVALSRTVACLLASGWLALLRHPDQLTQLHSNPELVPKAIEEMLRYASLPQSIFRRASKPVVISGTQIAEGDRVVLRLALANRDPLQFSGPNTFDLARRGPAHLSLGFGPHSCVGAALIRMTAAAATRVFVSRFAGFELTEPVEWKGGEGFRSPARLLASRKNPRL
jgi:cytochrome P450